MKRFPLEMYASLELNRCKFVAAGNIIAQTPLGEEFTKDAPCENGMWVCAETANGVMKSIAEVTDPIGVVFTSEKEYDDYHVGLKTFGRKIAGDMPRVGVFALGDVLTTNCLQYDESEYANEFYDDAIMGLQRIKQEKPKVVVIDLGLSKVSGLEMVNILRSNPVNHHIKIVVTCKVYNKKLAQEAYHAGADYFIKSPINQSILEKILELTELQENFFEM